MKQLLGLQHHLSSITSFVKVGAQNWYIQKVIKIPESGPSQYTDNRTASGQQGVLPPIDTILDPSNSPSKALPNL
jgi:hypothetical protein